MIYERAEGPAAYPMIAAKLTDDGTPLGWGALSALAAGEEPGMLFAVVGLASTRRQPSIFTIDATQTPAADHRQARRHARRRSGPEARHRRHRARRRRRLLARLRGRSRQARPARADPCRTTRARSPQEIGFPVELLAGQTRFGLEGITTVGEGDDLTLVMAVQREWERRPEGPDQASRLQAEGQGMVGRALPAGDGGSRLDRPLGDHRA